MKRRKFLSWSLAGASGLSGSLARGEPTPLSAAEKLMASPAVVMAPRADGAEVVWAVNRLCRGWVECRAAGGKVKKFAMDRCGFVPQNERILRVRLDHLPAGMSLELRAVTEALDGSKIREESAWKKFRTLDPRAGSTRFVVWNDTHEQTETLRQLHAVTPQADFFIWNGDVCNDWHHADKLAPTLLYPGGNDVSDGRPLQFVWGNHDMRGKWAFRAQDIVAAPEDRPFTAFRSGPVAVICLHTGEDKPDDHPSFGGRVALEPLRAEQAKWLEKTIERPEIKNAPFRVVFCHIPLRWTHEKRVRDYSKGDYDNFAAACRDAWDGPLRKWGAQVIISGHTHRDAWIPGDADFPYAQLVSGGPKPADARWIEGTADSEKLLLTMRDLAGNVSRRHEFAPIRS